MVGWRILGDSPNVPERGALWLQALAASDGAACDPQPAVRDTPVNNRAIY